MRVEVMGSSATKRYRSRVIEAVPESNKHENAVTRK